MTELVLTPPDGFLDSADLFSADGIYRYWLMFHWAPGPPLMFVMLNPSTARRWQLDPTVRKDVAIARHHGFGRLEVCNAFAVCSTDPSRLPSFEDPIGPDNEWHVRHVAQRVAASDGLVVCAWGNHADHLNHGRTVARWLLDAVGSEPLRCLGTNGTGHPVHPLYQPNDAPLLPFDPATLL